LKSDGVIGPATVRAMTGGDTNASKIDKLVVALEQARWLPEDLGSRYVMINQPAYMVYYQKDGKEQLSMRVVGGGKNNQTYFFDDESETVEVNTVWGV
ncbi:peptidoglycan-binding protein, partial [Rhizobium ruizarguesonis]